MDDTSVVGGFQTGRNLYGDLRRLVDWHRTASETCSQRFARDVLQHEELFAVMLLEPVYARDVRVVQLCEQFRLALESRRSIQVVTQLFRQRLDRHVTIQARIARERNDAHPPPTELANDGIGSDLTCAHRPKFTRTRPIRRGDG